MVRKLLIRFGKWLKIKHNFISLSTKYMGTVGAVGSIWVSIEHGNYNILAWVILVFLAYFLGYLWGVLMWEFFGKAFVDRSRSERD